MDVFFVISGYLITRLIIQEKGRSGKFSYSRFYVRRIRRLMPAALAVIGASLILFYPILAEADLASFLRSVPYAILSLANVNYYNEIGYFDTAAHFKPLLHTWSLAVEEQFYLIWPTLFLLLMRFRKGLLFTTLVLLIASVVLSEVWINRDPSAAYYLLPFRAFELLIGGALAIRTAPLSPDARSITLSPQMETAAAWAGLAMILSSYAILSEHSRLPGLNSLLPCIGAALVIAYGANGGVGRILTWKPIVWIGLISYSLYLVHWPVWVYVSYRLPSEPSLLIRLSLFPISIGLAAASYYFIERPFRHTPSPGRRWKNAPFLGGISACMIVLCAAPYVGKRMPQLLKPTSVDAQSVAEMKREFLPYPNSSNGSLISRLTPPESSSLNVLVLGDSHALHLRAGARKKIVPQGVNFDFAALSGCPPLFGATHIFSGNNEVQQTSVEVCRDHVAIKEILALSEKYDVVILASMWFSMLEAPNSSPPKKLLTYADNFEWQNLADSRRIFEETLTNTVETLLNAGKSVVLFSQVPPLGRNQTQCLSLFPWVERTNDRRSRCYKLTRDEVREVSQYADGVLESMGEDGRVLTIIPQEIFCDELECLLYAPNSEELLYHDGHHLSSVGSSFLFDEILKNYDLLDFIRAADAGRG